MVARNLLVFDSEALLVTDDSPFRPEGSPIINNSSTPNGTIFEFQSGFGRQDVVVDDTGGDPDIFEDDDVNNHAIIDGGGLVPTGTQVESESIIFLRALDEFGNETGPTIRLTVFSQGGNFEDVWGFATDDFLVPGVKYVKTAGSNNGDSDYEDFIPCFVAGTMIRTPNGPVAIEDLDEDSEVWTTSNPRARVMWAGSTTVKAEGNLAPVRIAKGVLGNTQDLLVSPQHRMLIGGAASELLFSEDAVLVPAIHLVGMEGVTQEEGGMVDYVHIMFPQHEVIEANGALSESFFPGEMAMHALGRETREELLKLFPHLDTDTSVTALPCVTGAAASVIRDYLDA